jgi:DNA-binding CsgD family transcriptional regulator
VGATLDLKTSERVAVFAFNVNAGLIYLNDRAQRLSHALAGPEANGLVPPEVVQLCHDVAQAIRVHGDLLGSGHVRREARRDASVLVLKGFTIPGPLSEQRPLILILADLATPEGSHQLADCDGFGLTPREQDVLTLLGHGITTQEIALQLGITEESAEAHVDALMKKANVTSRTAVLTELLRVRAAKMRHLTNEEHHGVCALSGTHGRDAGRPKRIAR